MINISKKDEMTDVNKNEFKKRLFIAIDIPEAIRDNIHNLATDMLVRGGYVRVVPASNIHITLKFLGDVNINKRDRIEEAIKITADSFERFKYEISGAVSAFPDPGNARVVFLEVDKGGEQICKIYNELEDNLARIKIEREKRKFSPHITVARLKNREDIKELIINQGEKINAVLDCKEITLFESRLRPEGAEYIVLNKFGLK